MADASVTHPTMQLDDLVHQRVRLGILAVLSEADKADFVHLREVLEVTDGNLSRHLSVLEEAGYVTQNKAMEGSRPRTWVRATRDGRRALERHLAALRELMEQVER